jgi:chromosome partitioning protein
MQRIVVLNPKGGSGKTTLAINLAAYFALRGDSTLLMDRDPQGSATRWLRKRKAPQAPIHGIATFEHDARTTRSWQMRIPDGTQKVIVDSPAAVEARALPGLTLDAHKILVPVLPSDIDIHAASRCIADLLLVAKVHRSERRLVIVANRARRYTKAFQALIRFLQSLKIPVGAVLRDSQAYVRSGESGMGIHEMKGALLRDDLETWKPLLEWLDQRKVSLFPLEEPAPEITGAGPTPGTIGVPA